MTVHPLVPGLALAVLAGAATPARAERTFTNRSEFVVCLVPDPDRPPPAGIRIILGPGSEAREDGDPAEALTGRIEAKTAGASAPIALKRLSPDWRRTVLYLAPGGSVTFAAAGTWTGGSQAARFRIGSPGRAGLDGIAIEPGRVELVFAVEGKAGGPALERLDGSHAADAPDGEPGPYMFRIVAGDPPGLDLEDRPEPFACAIL